jgi:hypothetical protein
MDPKAFLWAVGAGAILQLAMVLAGHQVAVVKSNFMWGGLLFSAVAGAIYARLAGGGLGSDLIGGLCAGAACALIGLVVSHLLGDVPAVTIAFGTVSSAVTGLIGAAILHYLR